MAAVSIDRVLTYRTMPCRDAQMVIAIIPGATRRNSMMDLLMLALAFGFFALAIGYTYACERL
jgi:hypothetical protein